MNIIGWDIVTKFDPRAAALADRHYSRRKIGSPQFMPPGETLVLLTPDARALCSAGGVLTPIAGLGR